MEFTLSSKNQEEIEEVSSAGVKNESKVRVELPSNNRSVIGSRPKPLDSDDDEAAEEVAVPPAERNISPKDVIEFTDEDESICIIGTWGGKVTRIAGLENMTKIKEIILRSCLVGSMEGIEDLLTLQKLELYDNQIEQISSLDRLLNLKILDLSFNSIRIMTPNLVQSCPLLEELYVAQNKLRKIEGLEGLSHLRVLDLGANRIRSMEGLSTLTSMQSLWLGKNKIEEIGGGIGSFLSLKQLDIQNNRLTSLGSELLGLTSLCELYLACNGLETVQGIYLHII
jgi:protein phosphatase 1 regulatory subunit 7